MKKLLGLLALGIIVIVFVFSGSGKGADLLILNWGDYLSSDVIHSFEEKYGVDKNLCEGAQFVRHFLWKMSKRIDRCAETLYRCGTQRKL